MALKASIIAAAVGVAALAELRRALPAVVGDDRWAPERRRRVMLLALECSGLPGEPGFGGLNMRLRRPLAPDLRSLREGERERGKVRVSRVHGSTQKGRSRQGRWWTVEWARVCAALNVAERASYIMQCSQHQWLSVTEGIQER